MPRGLFSKHQARLFDTCSNTSFDRPGAAAIRSSAGRIIADRLGSNLRQRPNGVISRAAICGLSLSAATIMSARNVVTPAVGAVERPSVAAERARPANAGGSDCSC